MFKSMFLVLAITFSSMNAIDQSVRDHFCWFNSSSPQNESVNGLVRLLHFVFIRIEFDDRTASSNQSTRDCLYHVFDLRTRSFMHQPHQCSGMIGNGLSSKDGHLVRLVGYAKSEQNNTRQELLYRDYSLRHKKQGHNDSSEMLEHDIITSAKQFTAIDPDKEILLTLLESRNVRQESGFVALTKVNSPIWYLSKQSPDESVHQIVKYRAMLEPSTPSIISAYQSENNDRTKSWLHLFDDQNRIISVPMGVIDQEFNACLYCKVIYLDPSVFEPSDGSTVASINEHFECHRAKLDPKYHHSESEIDKPNLSLSKLDKRHTLCSSI